jgi:response regulator RpfG family c-di-GMP phosphodiesterase
MMNERILCVDDDVNILEGYRRQLRKEFSLEIAVGPTEGLQVLTTQGPFSVVVSDLQMPEMNGIQFLSKVLELSPDTTRLLLTGKADLQSAIDAINRGKIFRFLTKPCSAEQLADALTAGISQYRLVTAERELLEQTLSGSIKVLCEILSLVNPEAFGRSARITRLVETIARHMQIAELWPIKIAALLSQIGCVILPEAVLKKVYRGETLTSDESQLYNQHPYVAADLVAKIPRMKHVGDIIRLQDKHYESGGGPDRDRSSHQAPLEARILKVALDFDVLESAGKTRLQSMNELKNRTGRYDPNVLKALNEVIAENPKYDVQQIRACQLRLGMILGEDILTANDVVLASKGQEVNESITLRIQNSARMSGVKEPFMVLVSVNNESAKTDSGGSRKAA